MAVKTIWIENLEILIKLSSCLPLHSKIYVRYRLFWAILATRYTAKCSALHGEMLCVTRRNVLRYMTEMEYFANFTKYLSKTRSKLNSRDPNQKKLNQMYFPQNLHYVRFTAKKAWNMKEFEVACRNSDQIYLHKQSRSRSKTNYWSSSILQ